MNEAAAQEDRHRRRAGAHIDHGGAEIGLVVGQNRKAGDIGARRPWPRRRDGSARPRASDCAPRRRRWWRHACRRRIAAAEHAARIADAVRRRRSSSRSAANAGRRGRRAANAGCRRRAPGRYRLRTPLEPTISISAANSSLASRPAETDSTTDSISTDAMRSAPSTAWRIASSAWPRLTTPPAFMPRATVWPKPTTSMRMAAAGQHLLRRVRPQPRDQAGDLARTDIERGDQSAAPRRDRLHLGRQAVMEGAHASPPFFFFACP